MRTRVALVAGKLSGGISRFLNIGGGSTFPGRVARFFDSGFVHQIEGELPKGSILITGTNGKTTTATLLADILDGSGIKPIHNSTGANLMAGIASTLVRETDLSGKLSKEIAVFEVDEATIPEAVKETNPRLILVNNLFRDQLDRYGELDTLAKKMKEAITKANSEVKIILNADDPLVASIGSGIEHDVFYYGIETPRYSKRKMEHAADSKFCSFCGAKLRYDLYQFGHLGRYHCVSCGWEKPETSVSAIDLETTGMNGTICMIRSPKGTIRAKIPLPGLYNIYNVLGAFSCALCLGIEPEGIIDAIENFRAAFGRLEEIKIGEKKILMILAKNPAGFNEVLRMLAEEDQKMDIMLALNDNIADGRDVSWIWDVDLEVMAGKAGKIFCSGIRSWDMALRVSYAGLQEESLVCESDLSSALDIALKSIPHGGTLFLISTYTAMLDIRKILAKKGYVAQYWEM
ncbi:MAG: Mur ligase family protein [Actinomycetota bacterium]|nr:Mur ligase family protein [Actinomycetota bacterium]